jgi:hypothetical protein
MPNPESVRFRFAGSGYLLKLCSPNLDSLQHSTLQESNQPLVSGSLLYASYVEDSGLIADEQIAMIFGLEHGGNLNFLFTSKK